jgi:hypothetical protein
MIMYHLVTGTRFNTYCICTFYLWRHVTMVNGPDGLFEYTYRSREGGTVTAYFDRRRIFLPFQFQHPFNKTPCIFQRLLNMNKVIQLINWKKPLRFINAIKYFGKFNKEVIKVFGYICLNHFIPHN